MFLYVVLCDVYKNLASYNRFSRSERDCALCRGQASVYQLQSDLTLRDTPAIRYALTQGLNFPQYHN